MFNQAINLTEVFWRAEHSDGEIICRGPSQYEKLDRNKLEIFTFIYKNKPILEIHPNGRTLVWRMKTIKNQRVSTGEERILARVHILALLAKPGGQGDQRCQVPWHPGYEPQVYFHNMEETTIYWLFENAKVETRNKFSVISPYRALHLREDEFTHLMERKEVVIPIPKPSEAI